jgi:hypothetical protein
MPPRHLNTARVRGKARAGVRVFVCSSKSEEPSEGGARVSREDEQSRVAGGLAFGVAGESIDDPVRPSYIYESGAEPTDSPRMVIGPVSPERLPPRRR